MNRKTRPGTEIRHLLEKGTKIRPASHVFLAKPRRLWFQSTLRDLSYFFNALKRKTINVSTLKKSETKWGRHQHIFFWFFSNPKQSFFQIQNSLFLEFKTIFFSNSKQSFFQIQNKLIFFKSKTIFFSKFKAIYFSKFKTIFFKFKTIFFANPKQSFFIYVWIL